jgi:hypothetical protein
VPCPLTGSLPSDLSGYEELSLLDVSANQLDGSMPTGGVLVSRGKPWAESLARLGFRGAAPVFCNNTLLSARGRAWRVFSPLLFLQFLPTLLATRFQCLDASRCLPCAALPPNLLVLDVSLNDITGPLPSPLPQSLVYLGATEAALTGRLPEVPADSSLRQVLLGGNDLEGMCACPCANQG